MEEFQLSYPGGTTVPVDRHGRFRIHPPIFRPGMMPELKVQSQRQWQARQCEGIDLADSDGDPDFMDSSGDIPTYDQ